MARTSTQPGWSVQVGTALGIPIRIHVTFVLLVMGIVWSRRGDSPLLAGSLVLLVFGCVLLHELGHAAMAKRLGVRTRDIVLYPIGGIARLENMPGGRAELLIALAGPLVNLALALVLLPVVALLHLSPGSLGSPPPLLHASQLVLWLLAANLVLFVFNLIPAFPMDGGRVLRAGLALVLSEEHATQIAATVGQAIAILFGIGGIGFGNPVLVLIALFVFLGASQEAFYYRQRTAVQGRTAREAMVTRFEVLAPQDSLERAARLLLATHQQNFPVLDAWRRLAGVLTRARLLEGLAQLGGSGAVLEVMEREVGVVGPEAGLDEVLQRLRGKPLCPVIVLDAGGLLGMITLENVTECLELRRRS